MVLAVLSLGVCVSNGFARFAYGLILPAMRSDLGWTYTQAGWINTSNALGYLAGAALTFALVRKFPAYRLFAWGMIGTSASLLLSGAAPAFWMLTVLRITAGIFGALVFISGGALATRLFAEDRARSALAIAIYFGGGGLGMMLSGATIPVLFAQAGTAAWPWAWFALGLASFACCLWSIWASRVMATTAATEAGSGVPNGRLPTARMLPELSGYCLFGTGYIVYITFLVAWMNSFHAGTAVISAVWVTIGIGIALSPFIWRPILARFDGGAPLALASSTCALAILVGVVVPSVGGLLASALLFGLAVFIGPASVTAFSRKNLDANAVGPAIALFTFVFAAGQVVGPVTAGVIGDSTGSIRDGLTAAAAIMLAGAALAAVQRPLER